MVWVFGDLKGSNPIPLKLGDKTSWTSAAQYLISDWVDSGFVFAHSKQLWGASEYQRCFKNSGFPMVLVNFTPQDQCLHIVTLINLSFDCYLIRLLDLI